MIKNILFILTAHFTGDYLFQSDYLAQNKGKSNYILLAHSVLYVFGVMLVAYIMNITLNPSYLLLLIANHFFVDYIKAVGFTPRYLGDKGALILDQAIHYLVLFGYFIK